MFEKLIICCCFILFCAANLSNGLSGTICKTYSDVSKVESSCTGKTIFVEKPTCSKQPVDCVPASQLNKTTKERVHEHLNPLKEQLQNLNKNFEILKSRNLCFPNPCENHETCFSGNNEYVCNCTDGSIKHDCSIDHDPCIPNPCKNNGTCFSGNNEYVCKCTDGSIKQSCSPCINGLIYGNQCLKLASITDTTTYQFSEAQQRCADLDSSLVEVTSDAMYDAVAEYVKMNWLKGSSWNYVIIWLGSTFQPINNPNHVITLTNQTTVRLPQSWINGYPVTGSLYETYDKLLMYVSFNSTKSYQGIYNKASDGNGIPLCAYKM